MGSDTFCSCGKVNRRFQQLVGDKRVWSSLLKGIDNFTKEELDQLVNIGGSNSERMADVVKEVIRRFIFLTDEGGDCFFSGSTRLEYLTRRLFRVKVGIQGGDGDTFEIAGEDQLKELNSVAQAVGAKLAIKEVQTYRTLAPGHRSLETFELIAGLVDKQEEEVDKIEFRASEVEVWDRCAVAQMDVFISLLIASKEWTVQSISIGLSSALDRPMDILCSDEIWRTLVRKACCGKIGTLVLLVNIEEEAMKNKEDVKKVWEITENLEVEFYTMSNGELVSTSRCGGGGKGVDPKTTWEEIYQDVLKKICKL